MLIDDVKIGARDRVGIGRAVGSVARLRASRGWGAHLVSGRSGRDVRAAAAGFIGTGAFTNVAGQLRYGQPGDGYTHLYADRNGDGTSDLEILLSGSVTLAAINLAL